MKDSQDVNTYGCSHPCVSLELFLTQLCFPICLVHEMVPQKMCAVLWNKKTKTTNHLISQESKTEIQICLFSGLMFVSCRRLSHSGKNMPCFLFLPLCHEPTGRSPGAVEGDSALTHRIRRHSSHPAAPVMLFHCWELPAPSMRFLSSSVSADSTGDPWMEAA